MTIVHDAPELGLEHFDKALAVSGAELSEERARLADLPSERLSEYAVLRREVLLEQMGKHAMVVDECGQTLRHLAIRWVEVLPEDRRDCLLLASDVSLELPVDVVDEGLSDILQACFLGLSISVGEGPQPHRPRIGSELMSLLDREFAK